MIKITKIETYGWEAAVRGMRNPLNSWAKSDSNFENGVKLGDADIALMKRLRASGTDHRKFMRMITVSMDITAPLYWWKQFDAYKVGTVADSCSTMHKLMARPFESTDFSFDETDHATDALVEHLNCLRKQYLETQDKRYWRKTVQYLPSSYNQKRTVLLNYEVLANMYKSRKDHKLDEWREFCTRMKYLPLSELITGEE